MNHDTHTIQESGYDSAKIAFWGSKYLCANGYMGLRTTPEECTAKDCASLTLAGLYDQKDTASWREPVNLPSPFHLLTKWNDTPLNLLKTNPQSHKQRLLISSGVYSRESKFNLPTGLVTVSTRRFVSMANFHLMALRCRVSAPEAGTLSVTALPFDDIWDINGPHLENIEITQDGEILVFGAQTIELKKRVAMAVSLYVNGKAAAAQPKGFALSLFAGKETVIEIYAAVYKDGDADCEDPKHAALRTVRMAYETGFDALKRFSTKAWRQLWDTCDVVIDGDDAAQTSLRYSLYLLLASAPLHTDGLAIPARGLSGQVYKGAFFWDTEIYMMPFFAACLPDICKNLAMYRVKTLEGARQKARKYGYTGAFYPWESQEDGREGCTDFNLTDIFTGRPMRTYFNSGQIHISADVAYGIWLYYRASGDETFLVNGGAEVLLECARFFYSHAYYKPSKDRYEFLDVTCADEYHERVNNNAYTNGMIYLALSAALEVLVLLKTKHQKTYLALDCEQDIKKITELRDKLFIRVPDKVSGLIEQFDGYFDREDVTPQTLQGRELKKHEYWGSPTGLAVETQVIKQADVILLMALTGEHYTLEQKLANWRYYEPRTEHGSSLSSCMYALLAAQCGMTDWAYQFFQKTAELDLIGDYKLFLGDLYIGGTHPAANGGAWMVAVNGFAGLSLTLNGVTLDPKLPKQWNFMEFSICWHEQRLHIKLSHAAAIVCAATENSDSVPVAVNGRCELISAGKLVNFTIL